MNIKGVFGLDLNFRGQWKIAHFLHTVLRVNRRFRLVTPRRLRIDGPPVHTGACAEDTTIQREKHTAPTTGELLSRVRRSRRNWTGAFIGPRPDYTDFLWTGELFVARPPAGSDQAATKRSARRVARMILIGSQHSARSAPRSPASGQKPALVGVGLQAILRF